MLRAALGWLGLATACGRLGFEARRADAPLGDDEPVAHVGSFVGHTAPAGLVDTFSAAAARAGDAILIHVFCETTAQPTAVSISAPGWTLVSLGNIVGSTGGTFWATTYGAIAPDTVAATFSVTWTTPPMCTFIDELGDEFTGNNTAGAIAIGRKILCYEIRRL